MKFVDCTLAAHGAAILDIFNDVIANTTALYDYHSRTSESMVSWFQTKSAGRFPVIGAVDDHGVLLGFVSYGTFRAWPAYKYSVEHSIHIHKDHRGKGLGRALLERIIDVAKEQGYHLIIGGIDADNAVSIALHKKLGFVHSGTINEAGYKFGRWLDVAFYQLKLPTPANPVDG